MTPSSNSIFRRDITEYSYSIRTVTASKRLLLRWGRILCGSVHAFVVQHLRRQVDGMLESVMYYNLINEAKHSMFGGIRVARI